jgi:D-lactate dehydrogenase (cytochrome)
VNEAATGIYDLAPSPEGMKIVAGEVEISRGYSDYLRDESRVQAKGVRGIFFPASVENIAFALLRARERGERVTLSGGRTGICAGSVPLEGGYLVSLERMCRLLDLRKDGREHTITAEAGIRLSELNQRLAARELGLQGEAAEEFARGGPGFFYPPDPTEQTASLGGTVATNASGARTLFFGPTRDYVTAVDVVLATGELLRVRRGDVREEGGVFRVPRRGGGELLIPAPGYDMPSTKNSAGLFSKSAMDLIDLFIGCEGILGVIARVTVRLLEEPSALAGGVAFFPGEAEALDFVRRARVSEPKPLALEYFDFGALSLLERTRRKQGPTSEIPAIPGVAAAAGTASGMGRGGRECAVYFESAVFPGGEGSGIGGLLRVWRGLIGETGGDPRAAWGAVTKRDIQRLKTFRHALPEAVNDLVSDNKKKDERIHKVGTDMAVPDDRLREMMGVYRSLLIKTGIGFVVFGHIGNNHVHVNMLPGSFEQLLEAKRLYTAFAREAVAMGGSVSAEHGIGKLKKEYLALQYGPRAFGDMRAVKNVLDPAGILNPGDML